MLIFLALVCWGFGPIGSAIAEKKPKKRIVVPAFQIWKTTLSSKVRFGSTAKSKLRTRWIQLAKLPIKNKALWEFFGKSVPIRCRLHIDDLFECQGYTAQGVTLVESSSQWPAGRIKIVIHVRAQGMSMEISNQWKKRIRGKRYRKR